MTPYIKGLILTSTGVLILSPDAALIRLVNLDTPSTMAWRAMGAAITFSLMFLIRHRKDLPGYLKQFWPWVLVALPFALGTQFTFVVAVSFTSPAIVLLLVGATPFVSALTAWLILKQKTPRPTMIAIAVGLAGVAITLLGETGAEVTLIGNLVAVMIPISISLLFLNIL